MGQNVSLNKYIKPNRTTPRENLGSCTSPQAANRYQVTCNVEHSTFDRGMHNRKPLSQKPKDPGLSRSSRMVTGSLRFVGQDSWAQAGGAGETPVNVPCAPGGKTVVLVQQDCSWVYWASWLQQAVIRAIKFKERESERAKTREGNHTYVRKHLKNAHVSHIHMCR